jgi:transposase
MKSKQEIKSRVYKFYENNKDKGKKYVAAHFMAEGVPKATIYRHIESAATGKPLARKKGRPLARKKGSGRKPKINTPKNRAKLTKMFNHRKGMSLRKAAKVFNCHNKTIWEILKTLKRPVLC